MVTVLWVAAGVGLFVAGVVVGYLLAPRASISVAGSPRRVPLTARGDQRQPSEVEGGGRRRGGGHQPAKPPPREPLPPEPLAEGFCSPLWRKPCAPPAVEDRPTGSPPRSEFVDPEASPFDMPEGDPEFPG